ncbi:unnamed protein product [Eruca vesicaria subsp. sativa]|uniref:Dilute domain-containing protein n=1 Tax=Eruca vesicaria subsp. sativa TaxID=29727 RepID=A0ABC8KH72_ERUVS|nr:unnamed protein product [Eruca vesicaria subsp. sativa]
MMKGRTTNTVQSKRSTKNGKKDQKLQKKNSQKRLSDQEKHNDLNAEEDSNNLSTVATDSTTHSDPSEAYETVDVRYLDDDVTERKEKEDSVNGSVHGLEKDDDEQEVKDVWEDASNGGLSAGSENDSPDVTENNGEHLEDVSSKEEIDHLEARIERLEEELREVAALEISLYSIVPDHSSSAHKLHTPARRLSRIYIHACKHFTRGKRARIARNSVTGLVLVSRSCGNDVSRLTFWLSNIISLREIISQQFGKSHITETTESNGSKKGLQQLLEDWQETETFTTSLETIEHWIFSRIVESVWWQVFTPHMQSPESNSSEKQGNFSISLWNNAFREALQRLCPVRGSGNECGCLPVLARMVMEKCIGRFDVAMFNAILRESEHQIPTDPISDPILDSRVLPIHAGDLSFGSGAQLKNAIGNWSRCLTEMFGMNSEDDDHVESEGSDSSKAFVLLNELSDLLMLPKDMLMESSIREEICPSITLPVIKRILCNFTPDEFCPDHVPGAVLEELNSAESNGDGKLSEESFPYAASSVSYTPPSTKDVAEKVAESAGKMSRNVSMIQKRGYTSDEELEELDSPLTSIVDKSSEVTDSATTNERYKLLRQVWV